MIELSQAAVSEIGRLKSKQLLSNIFVRLAVKPGGCSGWFYDISFDDAVKDDDRLFDSHGIRILIDPASLDYINGLILDYSEDLMGGGFRFHNQRAIATCGCGNSFSISQ
ncbi:HesB/IscA family protein [Tolypothrix sp. VBCCA 56010]|uniref:HesB/IscA family protein n=1 Tax=Tolypothrix sp. VBCCA 56010 TaxID=3137731 RepID=UPI003D7DE040